MVSKNIKYIFQKIFFPQIPKPPYSHVCQVGDPVLRMAAEKVPLDKIKSPEIQTIISRMTKVMKHFKSHGLSAPQIGIPLRIIIMEYPEKDVKDLMEEIRLAREITAFPLTTIINPEMKILDYEKTVFPEGCESLRGYSGNVTRYRSIRLSGFNQEGESISRTFAGWAARIGQHEMDHLQGELYIDKMDLKTFQNDGWQRINVYAGRVKIKFI